MGRLLHKTEKAKPTKKFDLPDSDYRSEANDPILNLCTDEYSIREQEFLERILKNKNEIKKIEKETRPRVEVRSG